MSASPLGDAFHCAAVVGESSFEGEVEGAVVLMRSACGLGAIGLGTL